MYTDFDEMDIEPNNEPPMVLTSTSVDMAQDNGINEEELQTQLLLRTVPLDDGSIGYVFTCTKSGPLATWRCHACNFVDTWRNLMKHIDTKWHHDSMSKFQHSRVNFSKVENAISDISKGQPLPPGMEDFITGPCYILKTLQSYDQPLIGLEFLLEMNLIDSKEPRYLCLLCDKRGDPRSILVHLTSQSHYLIYLRKYFRGFYSLIDKLPKSVECRSNVNTVTSHLVAKLEEKYGRLQPTATQEDLINNPEQRAFFLQKIDNGIHFSETPEDRYLEGMLTVDYVQNTQLLIKNFPLKPKRDAEEKDESSPKSLFNRSSKTVNRKQLRNRDSEDHSREESPEVLFVSSGTTKMGRSKYDHKRSGRERSPHSRPHHRSRSPDHGRRKYSPPPHHRSSSKYSLVRSRSPYSRRSRSRSPPDWNRYRSHPHSQYSSSRHSSYRQRSPRRHRSRSPSKPYASKHRDPSRSKSPLHDGWESKRERGPFFKSSRSRSRSYSPRSSRPHQRETLKKEEKSNGTNQAAYLKELKELEENMHKDEEKYTETPENHPAYQEEWKKFWCNRFKELQAEGKCNPHTYDYKPEWISFWNVRMKELFEEEFDTRRNDLKSKYHVIDDVINNEATTINKESECDLKTDSETKSVMNIKTMWKELTGFEIHEEPIKRKSPSPWEEDNEQTKNEESSANSSKTENKNIMNILDDDSTQPISPEPLTSISDSESLEHVSIRGSRSRSRSRSRSHSPRSHSRSRSSSCSKPRLHPKEVMTEKPIEYPEYPFRKPPKKIHFDNPLNIITVLRQLSVLEFQLGSYASHVIKLLSSGLALEKLKPQSSIDLLTHENVMFLELVKEKLKGQLLAGVVQKSMVKATLFCIKNIEELLNLAPKIKPTAPPPIPAPPPTLIYGSGAEQPPTPSTNHSYGAQMYGAYPGMSGNNYKHRRFPYPKQQQQGSRDSGNFSGYQQDQMRPYEDPKRRPPLPEIPKDDIVIDEKVIAVQIAEVLVAQGRTDVSEEELRILISTVVDNLKEEQRNRRSAKERGVSREPVTTSVLTAAVVSSSTLGSSTDITSIPAGFNLNDVSSSTFALLQDAFQNASSNTSTVAIEMLPEAEVIQLLKNFKNIPRFKQEKLIEYLKKLEDTDPRRVEELRKYVNVNSY